MAQVQIKQYVFDTGKLLGKGSTGTVYLGVDTRNGRSVAVKVIELKNIDNQVTKYLLQNEVKALQLTNHPNVLHAYDVISDPNCCYVVTNYCPNNTLEHFIKARGRIPEDQALKIFKEIVEGFANMMSKKILHRDLKPSNVLFSDRYQPVICDFGYCEIEGYLPKPKLQYNVGSPAYMAPESITNNLYSESSEIWSLGTILYQMLQGRSYSQGRDVMEAVMQIRTKGPYYPDGVSQLSRRIIRQCMALKPTDRIKLRDLMLLLQNVVGGHSPRPQIQNNQIAQRPRDHQTNQRSFPVTQSVYIQQQKIDQTQHQSILNGSVRRFTRMSEDPPNYPTHLQAHRHTLPRNPSQVFQPRQVINQQPIQQQMVINKQQQVQPIHQRVVHQNHSLIYSMREDRLPMNQNNQVLNPASNNLGVLEYDFDNRQMVDSFQMPQSAGDSSLYSPEDFPEYRPTRHQESFRSQPSIYSTPNRSIHYEVFHKPTLPTQVVVRRDLTNSQHTSVFPHLLQSRPVLQSNVHPRHIQQMGQNYLLPPSTMMSSKRSIHSNSSRDSMLNSITFNQPTGGVFAMNTINTHGQQQIVHNPFLKGPGSKIYSVPSEDGVHQIRKIQKLQLTNPDLLMNESKRRHQQQWGQPVQRSTKNQQQRFVTQIPIPRQVRTGFPIASQLEMTRSNGRKKQMQVFTNRPPQ